jgi:hypothetical protein
MKNPRFSSAVRFSLQFAFVIATLSMAGAVVRNPDLTLPSVIAPLKSNPTYNSRPYSKIYNLGATKLHVEIYMVTANPDTALYGLMTATSRQSLVTVAEAQENSPLQIDDVTLCGASMTQSRTVLPLLPKTNGSEPLTYLPNDVSQVLTSRNVEYSNNPQLWTPIMIPTNSGNGVIIAADRVCITVPATVSKHTFSQL